MSTMHNNCIHTKNLNKLNQQAVPVEQQLASCIFISAVALNQLLI
jgi:hypothetical protein